MKYSIVLSSVLCGALFACGLCFADDAMPKIRVSGSATLEMGQVVSGTYVFNNVASPTEMDKAWQERFLYRLVTDAWATEQIRLLMDLEGKIAFSYPEKTGQYSGSEVPQNVFVPRQIEGSYTMGNRDQPYLQFGMGYFPYKFNPDATDLGEFLFRSGTYPLYIISDFDHCYGELLGLRVSSILFGCLRQDLLFTSETIMFPTQDYSLSYVVHYSPTAWLDLGAGISLSHLISINGSYTSGKVGGIEYVNSKGDTVPYTFQGTKPAVEAAFDPKPLLPSLLSGILGKKDFRLYGEIFVSGWDDQVNTDTTFNSLKGYTNRWNRTAWMVGLNIPAFKLLDVLSLESEYFPTEYDDSFRQVLMNNSATPPASIMKDRTPWKWSLYAKRTIGKKFSIVGMMGRDHYRPEFPTSVSVQEMEAVVNAPKDWRWVLSFNIAM